MDVFSGDLCPERCPPSQCLTLASLLHLLDRIPALLWATDSEPRFTSLTGAALDAAGIRAHDFAGKRVEELFSAPTVSATASRAHARALEGQGSAFQIEVAGRDLEAHVEPLRSSGGEIVGVIGVALDDTERFVAERALRLSEQSYRLLIEEAPYGICRCTVSGQLLQVNRAMIEMLGYTPGEDGDLLEKDLPTIFALPAGFAGFRKALLNAGTMQGVESTWMRRDGREIHVRLGGRAVYDNRGEVLYLDVLAENITERKQLQERLNQAEKIQAIGQLAGGVAHDFNNLLTVIGGQIEVVLGANLDVDLQHRLEDAKRATERAAALTRQLLAFSRRQVLHSKYLDLNRSIDHLCRMLRRLLRENIELVFLPGRDIGFVKADPNQIEQVLMNMAINAQDAMPEGGRLKIETTVAEINGESAVQSGIMEAGTYVVVHVGDTGHGMDRETQSRIFEPFFTTKRVGEGTGLGLAMAYGVIRQSGGYIQVESRVGHGSTFRIYLPRVAMAEQAVKESLPTLTPRGSETILFAEDEASVRRLVAGYLGSLGYTVLPASDGQSAVETARAHPGAIDLLLSDLIMPKVGGLELASELRKKLPDLKTIFISGYAGHDVAGKDLDFLQPHFLQKPFSMQQLAKMIRQVLDQE